MRARPQPATSALMRTCVPQLAYLAMALSASIALTPIAHLEAQNVVLPPGEGLRELAPRGFQIGGIVGAYDTGFPDEFSEVVSVAVREFNALMIGVFSSDPNGPTQGKPQLESLDTSRWEAAVDLACGLGQSVHGHVLVYPSINAFGFYNGLDDAQIRHYVTGYAAGMVGSTAGRVRTWQVVNEIMANPGDPTANEDGLRTNYREFEAFDAVGLDYVAESLRAAHAADPCAELIINDFGIATAGEKSDRLLAYITKLRDGGVPIHGVGIQMHQLNLGLEPDYAAIGLNIRRFADAGFAVYLTELDVAATVSTPPTSDAGEPTEDFEPVPPTPDELSLQADIFAGIAEVALAEPGCHGLFLWDFIDQRNTFLHPIGFDFGPPEEPVIPNGSFTFPSPYTTVGDTTTAKPAYFALQDAFENAPRNYWALNCWWPFSGLLSRVGVQDTDGVYYPESYPYLERLTCDTLDWSSTRWQLVPVNTEESPTGRRGYRIRSLWINDESPDDGATSDQRYLRTGYLSRGGDLQKGQWVPNRDLYIGDLNETYYSQLWQIRRNRNGSIRLINQWGPRTGTLVRPRSGWRRWWPGDYVSFEGDGNRRRIWTPGRSWFLIEIPRGY
ncbi:MAG: endo-1,4-beta-xylanase [Aureliella sp.]